MSNPRTLTRFGHRDGCFSQHIPNRFRGEDGTKPECPHPRPSGDRCGGHISRQGCIRFENGVYTGYCPDDYKKLCIRNGWSPYLSRCANEACDEKQAEYFAILPFDRSGLIDRSQITSKTIKVILGLPPKVLCDGCCKGKKYVTTHHVKDVPKAKKAPQPLDAHRLGFVQDLGSDDEVDSDSEASDSETETIDVEDIDSDSSDDEEPNPIAQSQDRMELCSQSSSDEGDPMSMDSGDDEELCSDDEEVIKKETRWY